MEGMEGTEQCSRQFRWTVVTGVSDVSGCSANQRKTTGAFRTSWVPNAINGTPRGLAAMYLGRVLLVFACASAHFVSDGEHTA